jgi:lipid-binding SYLF domain-containing protein
MIQKAVGLAFVRASKVVLGVSLHGGSGIVIARLGDGTWSAPSAIGTWGLGFGLQFGLEVAEYIFILQTQESLDHFKRGSSFNIGGNVGAAVAGIGREAYGAASVGNTCTRSAEQQQVKEDEYNDEDSEENLPRDTAAAFGVAPIVAYAKSQGLYVGVSLEGSRIFTRSDVNARAYKFATGRELSAKDILSGKVATPPEAEDLYAALHRYDACLYYILLIIYECCSLTCNLLYPCFLLVSSLHMKCPACLGRPKFFEQILPIHGSTIVLLWGVVEVGILQLRPRIPFRFLPDYHVKRKKNAIRLKHSLRNSCMEEYPYNDSFPTWKRQAERLERNGGLCGSCFQKWDRYD